MSYTNPLAEQVSLTVIQRAAPPKQNRKPVVQPIVLLSNKSQHVVLTSCWLQKMAMHDVLTSFRLPKMSLHACIPS